MRSWGMADCGNHLRANRRGGDCGHVNRPEQHGQLQLSPKPDCQPLRLLVQYGVASQRLWLLQPGASDSGLLGEPGGVRRPAPGPGSNPRTASAIARSEICVAQPGRLRPGPAKELQDPRIATDRVPLGVLQSLESSEFRVAGRRLVGLRRRAGRRRNHEHGDGQPPDRVRIEVHVLDQRRWQQNRHLALSVAQDSCDQIELPGQERFPDAITQRSTSASLSSRTPDREGTVKRSVQ